MEKVRAARVHPAPQRQWSWKPHRQGLGLARIRFRAGQGVARLLGWGSTFPNPRGEPLARSTLDDYNTSRSTETRAVDRFGWLG